MAAAPFFCLYAHLPDRDTERDRDNTETPRHMKQKQRHRDGEVTERRHGDRERQANLERHRDKG